MKNDAETIISIKNIHKSFGGIYALSDVSFSLKEGEIHALVGENGAGKSTLIKIITGAYKPDNGVIEINAHKYDSLQPTQARSLGISAVYQEFNLLQDMSVAENIFLTTPPIGRFGLINVTERSNQAYRLLERLGAHKNIDPDELVKNLTVGEKQIVEIAKALALDARVLIMDEPSAVLPSRDLDRLFEVVKALRDEGRGIIYISHRLNEIFELADRVTVLKDGEKMGTKDVAETNNDELVHMMVGRELTDMYPPVDTKLGDVLLEAQDLCIENTVFDINFQLREGEILGLAGLGGSGRTTIARALTGLANIISGEIHYFGQDARMSPAWAARSGVVLVPEDRKAHGLILDQCIRFNITLPNLPQLERWRMIFKRHEWDPVISAMDEVKVRPAKPELEASSLSGGNQQKVVLAKWLMARPKIIVMDEPTRGIDVGAKAEIYLLMREIAQQGVGIIMASSELPELLGMSDRILVLHEGRIAGELSRSEASEEAIMHLATATNGAVISP
jgi:ABC-type sugar transport system ATPase subunit